VSGGVTARCGPAPEKAGVRPRGADPGPGGRGPADAASALCGELDIPHEVLDLSGAFEETIVGPFRESYRRGATRSPCVECNAGLKFGLAWDLAEATLGIGRLASGHNARTGSDEAGPYLARGGTGKGTRATSSTRSRRGGLPACSSPWGKPGQGHGPPAGRGRGAFRLPDARQHGPVLRRPGDYRALLDERDSSRGLSSAWTAACWANNRGLSGYTVGQRKGLGVAAPEPLYVAGSTVSRTPWPWRPGKS
jgi:tRNA-specific 2-thiouridylase